MILLEPSVVFSATIVLMLLEALFFFYGRLHAERCLREKNSRTYLKKVRRKAGSAGAYDQAMRWIFLLDFRKELPRSQRWMTTVLPIQWGVHLIAAVVCLAALLAGSFSAPFAVLLWAFAPPVLVQGGFIFVWWFRHFIVHGKDGTGWHF